MKKIISMVVSVVMLLMLAQVAIAGTTVQKNAPYPIYPFSGKTYFWKAYAKTWSTYTYNIYKAQVPKRHYARSYALSRRSTYNGLWKIRYIRAAVWLYRYENGAWRLKSSEGKTRYKEHQSIASASVAAVSWWKYNPGHLYANARQTFCYKTICRYGAEIYVPFI